MSNIKELIRAEIERLIRMNQTKRGFPAGTACAIRIEAYKRLLPFLDTLPDEPVEKQKEQKPAESKSHLTVQGKGVYKICPRCKERMVRDDSKVYTSMPPQYGYECPKCGEIEFDTTMYDNPEIEEQKPVDEQFPPLEGLDAIKAKYYDDGFKNGFDEGVESVKPAEWSEEDEDMLNSCISSIEEAKENRYAYKETDGDTSYDHEIAWLKSLRNRVGKESLQPHWKPSEEQMNALNTLNCHGDLSYFGQQSQLISLYNDLKKL